MTGHFTVGRIWDLTARAIISSQELVSRSCSESCSPLSVVLCLPVGTHWGYSLASGYATHHREYLDLCVKIKNYY